MDCCRHVNPFRICTGLRVIGYFMILLVAGIVSLSYFAVVVIAWGPRIFHGGIYSSSSLLAAIIVFVFHILLVLLIWSYSMVVCRDPGSIPENWSPNMIEESVEAGNSIALSDNDAPGVVASVWYPIERGGQDLRYCNRCQTHKPPRCHHCSICQRCVLKMDHHCVWVVNCVGARNYKFFLLFMFYTFLETILDTFALLPRFVKFFGNARHSGPSFYLAITFLVFILSLAFALSLLCFLVMHSSLLLSNTTTIEVYEKNKSVRWKYDVGKRKNFEQVFGTNKLFWLLPMYSKEDMVNLPALRISAADYVEGSATLASSIYTQALGVPTGSHGAFRDYQVDAITLEISPSFPFQKNLGHSLTIIKGGRLIEGVIRSVNNLLEKFHQSFFLYFFTSPDKFVSVGVYMIGFAFLAAPLPIVASAIFSGKFTSEDQGSTVTEKASSSLGSWQWIGAAKVVFMVHIWAIIVSLMPHFILQFPNLTPTMSMLIWISHSTITALFFYKVLGSPYRHSNPQHEWLLLKAVMISTTSIGLSLMSIINFATAQIGSLFLVPMCLIAQPLRHSKPVLLTTCNLLFMIIGFPPFALLISESLLKGSEGVCIGNFWEWTQSLWEWNSATYLHLLVIHLPCWVLFMHIIFHP